MFNYKPSIRTALLALPLSLCAVLSNAAALFKKKLALAESRAGR